MQVNYGIYGNYTNQYNITNQNFKGKEKLPGGRIITISDNIKPLGGSVYLPPKFEPKPEPKPHPVCGNFPGGTTPIDKPNPAPISGNIWIPPGMTPKPKPEPGPISGNIWIPPKCEPKFDPKPTPLGGSVWVPPKDFEGEKQSYTNPDRW